MQVTVYGPLRGATGGKTVAVEADPETVGDALDAFLAAYPRAEQHLVDCEGDFRRAFGSPWTATAPRPMTRGRRARA